ncbi:MAG: ABC transporter ATP-binding protein [Rhodobacteraceae bacterium]|nr:ABC transporter ATP-binding protein [Paracoccaceae bacterium]
MRGKDVTLEGVSITYPNGFMAVQPTDLQIAAGEFFSILGPSGCGKTTLLRTVSGFVAPSAGRVLIGGEDQAGRNPNARPTALIFQNLALFPLMSVLDNVAFGLEARGMPKRERRARAAELLALVALQDQADKTPPELSGGQRQRVAIARALAVEPAVLLLDEPLSALDLKLRSHMRAELRAIQKKTGVTFIYITHDQGEALTMSDRIAVMNAGRIEQVGTGDEVYSNPATAFAASFVGESNILKGRIDAVDGTEARIETARGTFAARNPQGMAVGAPAYLFVRPEAVRLGAGGNRIDGHLTRRDLEGPFVNLFFDAGGEEIAVHMTNTGALPHDLGESVALGFEPADALVLPEGPLAATGQELVGA